LFDSQLAAPVPLRRFGVDYFQGFHFGEPLPDPVWAKA